MPNYFAGAFFRNDREDSGVYRITGTTKNTGAPQLPVRRRVRLHDQPSGRVVREVWSDAATGAYSFDGIRMGVYYATAFDHTGIYNGVIATSVIPTPMPEA
jgi:hypothetical protein